MICARRSENAENQTVIPNICLWPLNYAAEQTGASNDLVDAESVLLSAVIIKNIMILPP